MGRTAARRGWRALALAAALGCATGPQLRDGLYRDREHGFAIAAPPPGWQPIRVQEACLAFRGPGGESMALLCHCDAGDAALDVLARRLRLGLGPHELVEERRVELAGRPAEVQSIALANARMKAVTRAAPPCVQDFVLVAQHDFDGAERVFDAWWASFVPAVERTP